MFRLSIILFFVLAFGGISVAQERAPDKCPSVSVSGPSGVVGPGESGFFIATVDYGHDGKTVTYNWSISRGTIRKGQGTKSIEVVDVDAGTGVVATVEIFGLPSGCPSTASESYIICGLPVPENIGELTAPSTLKPSLISELKKRTDGAPNNQLYITLHFLSQTSKKTVNDQTQGMIQKLVKAGIDESRITIASGFGRKSSVVFWLVPPGSSNPSLDQ